MEPLSFDKVKRYSLKERKSKVKLSDFGKPVSRGATMAEFIDSLPDILAGSDIRKVSRSILLAREKKLPILWCLGAHVIKVGLNPVLIDLMMRGFVTGIALNGAGIIHDVELALAAHTSEDVAPAMQSGSFGMAEETAIFVNEATKRARQENMGLGDAIGRELLEIKAPFAEHSLLARAKQMRIPVTVHVAIGGDIVHVHPEVSGEAIGAASFLDFRILCSMVSKLSKDSVLLNVGSAVVLPVVIEKAIAVCRNLGFPVEGFVGVNLDFMRHYRSYLNPVSRAKDLGGQGIEIIGHHEILIPLLAAAVKEKA